MDLRVTLFTLDCMVIICYSLITYFTWKFDNHKIVCTVSDVSRGFLGIPFSAGKFRAGAQKDIIMNFEQFSVINMYGWHG